MTKKTIEELADGEDVRTSAAVVAFDQSGETNTLKTSIRPNPLNAIYAKNQAQLEATLGADLIIPMNTAVTIIIDEDITLTKPFKKQAGSSLWLKSDSSKVTLIYNGTGALIQMDTPGVDIGVRTQIDSLIIQGNTLNECLAVEDSEFFAINRTILAAFAKVGFVKGMSVLWIASGYNTVGGGIDFIDNPFVDIGGSSSDNVTVPIFVNIKTLFNFITTVQTDVVFSRGLYLSAVADSFLFLDPNSGAGSSFTVRDSGIIGLVPESLFQKGVDEAVTAVADNGSGKMRCTLTGHGQENQTYAVLSGFTEPTYNKTSLITVVDANTFDTDIDFVVNDSGNINRGSLDSTSSLVLSEDNPDQPDSMFTGDAGLELASPITIPIDTQDVSVPITDVNWSYSNLERFEEDTVTPNQGRLVNKDISRRRYSITYSATINRSGGGGVNVGIVLLKNGTLISVNPPRVFTTTITPLTRTEIIELDQDDVIQIAVINYSGTNDIDVYQANLSVNRG